MTITNIRIFPYHRKSEFSLKATATIVINNALILQSIRIMEDRKNPGQFVVLYPTRRLERGGFRISFTPCTEESQKQFADAILDAYKKHLEDPSQTNFVLSEAEPQPFTISRSNIFPVLDPESRVRAKVNLELDGELLLRGMTLQSREDGSLWLRMPQRELKDGKSMDLFHPLTNKARNELTQAMMPYYDEAVRQAKKAAASAARYR